MAWLLREGEVLASLEVASSLAARSRGLLGKASFEGALLLRHTRSVHTVGMRFPIDVAFLTDDLHVIGTVTVPPYRVALRVEAAGPCSRRRPVPSRDGSSSRATVWRSRGERRPAALR